MARCQRGQIWSTRAPISTPHLATPKDIAIKRGEDRSGTKLYHHAHFHADQCYRGRDTPDRTKNTDTRDLIYDKMRTSVCACLCRTINQLNTN